MKSALAAKHERVFYTLEPERARSLGVAELIRDCEVDCWDAGHVRARRASCVLGWPKKVALKSGCAILSRAMHHIISNVRRGDCLRCQTIWQTTQMLDRCDSGDVPSTITRWKHSENSNKFVLLPMNTVPCKVSPLYRRISENGSVSLLQ